MSDRSKVTGTVVFAFFVSAKWSAFVSQTLGCNFCAAVYFAADFPRACSIVPWSASPAYAQYSVPKLRQFCHPQRPHTKYIPLGSPPLLTSSRLQLGISETVRPVAPPAQNHFISSPAPHFFRLPSEPAKSNLRPIPRPKPFDHVLRTQIHPVCSKAAAAGRHAPVRVCCRADGETIAHVNGTFPPILSPSSSIVNRSQTGPVAGPRSATLSSSSRCAPRLAIDPLCAAPSMHASSPFERLSVQIPACAATTRPPNRVLKYPRRHQLPGCPAYFPLSHSVSRDQFHHFSQL